MAGSPVSIISSATIKPLNPTTRHSVCLSVIGIFWRDYGYARTLNFYKTDKEFTSVIDSLKRSLAAALLHFYPLAGRFSEGDDGRLVVDCNDAGVEFVAASSNVPFSELEENDFPMQDLFRFLTRLENPWHPDDPILCVQVTSFLGGGIAIGTAANHALLDGFSFCSFMRSWGETCRGQPVSVPPLHMRTALSLEPVSPARRSKSWASLSSEEAHRGAGEEVEMRMLHLRADVIKKLKCAATSTAEDGQKATPVTSFEAMWAYLWRRRTRADKQLSEAQKVALRIAMNTRPRVVPPIPAAYFGHAAIHVLVLETTAGELRRESLGTIATRIHEKILLVNGHFIMEELRTGYDEPGNVPTAFRGGDDRVVTEMADSRRFGLYDADFGWSGKTVSVRPSVSRPEGVMALGPGVEDGSVDVFLSLKVSELAAFFSCEEEEITFKWTNDCC